jgi:hypothetical protein
MRERPTYLDELAMWEVQLPGVEHAVLPPHSDRPNPARHGEMLFLSVFAPGCVYALQASNGKIQWRRELNYLGDSAVVLAPGIVLAKTAQTLSALDPQTGEIVWEFSPYGSEGETLYSEPAVQGDRLFVGDRRGWLHCLSIQTGTVIWSRLTSQGVNNDVNASAVIAGAAVITATNAGKALAYSVHDGTPLWESELDGPCINHLFIAEGQVVAAAESLHFLNPATGHLEGRIHWPDSRVAFAAQASSNVAFFLGESFRAETLFVYAGTRPVREIQCSAYTRAVRFSPVTGLLYASGVGAIDIVSLDEGKLLHVLQPRDDYPSGYCLPDVTESAIYSLDGSGVVRALSHPPV